MPNLLKLHRQYWSSHEFVISVAIGAFFFIAAMVLHYAAGVYATSRAGVAVADLLLSRLPVMDVNIVFVEGNILFWMIVTSLMISAPKRIPFILKSLALFMLIRAFFVILTHLGPDPNEILIAPNSIIDKFTFGGDLFFSGHVGAPFLMALAFWHHYYIRAGFLLTSVIFAVTVLLGHLHYSIDVFAAYFISYGIYHIAKFIFEEDYRLMVHGIRS